MRYTLTADLLTGNVLIDTQHRQLFEAINKLMASCEQGQGRSAMGPVIDFLLKYVEKHFSDEERLQVNSKYPGYTAHRLFHQNYKLKLRTASMQIQNFGPTIAALNELNKTIALLVGHIRMEDKKMAAHLKISKIN